MTVDDPLAGFEALGPWVTRFRIGGQEVGGGFDPADDKRLRQFREHFPQVRTVLELGSLEGGHSFELAQMPGISRVVGIEGRPINIERAEYVQRQLALYNVQFIEGNLETMRFLPLGRFDVVFCVGLLYHLPEPWKLIRKLSRVTDRIFMWTHYATIGQALGFELEKSRRQRLDSRFGRLPQGFYYPEFGLADPLSGMSSRSFWPTLDGLRDMLTSAGFSKITIIEDDLEHPHAGPAVTLAAEKP
jgi:SAM-dependent methyltransferase